jgi:glutamate--cysteine ligase
MSVGKNKSHIGSVVVQEGIPTHTLVDRLPAEPVIYLTGTELLGGFLRTNSERGTEDNLNSQGMVFKKLCMSDLRHPSVADESSTDTQEADEDEPLLELVYGEIARISAIATGLEIAAAHKTR